MELTTPGRHKRAGLARAAARLVLPFVLLFPLLSAAQSTLDMGTPVGGGMMLGAERLIATQVKQIQSIPETASQPQRAAPKAPAEQGSAEPNEFQEFIAASLGKRLPIYGYDMFRGVPDTFAPLENVPVTPDYPIGPGDEIVIKAWGGIDIDFRTVVNRNGEIVLPKIGSVSVAGIRYQDLQSHLKKAIARVFRNFDLNVTLGKLRSIEVFVVGQAKRPGVYTVSSLSTLVNAIFASGGPSLKGSMRQIQVKRVNKVISTFDLYDLILKGDKSKDIKLLPGDVIYIPPIGRLAAISGSVNNSAIYELKNEKTSLADLIELAGGFTTTAAGQQVMVERIADRKVRKVEEFDLDKSGLERQIQDGDLVQVKPVKEQFDNAVTLRGNVADPGRRPWKEGMRIKDLIPSMDVLITPSYWEKQNQSFRNAIAGASGVQTEVKRTTEEINWDYALIERLKKDDLTKTLIPFNLGQAIGAAESADNHILLPGDVITIFSKNDIQVPTAKRPIYVRLEGEINAAGVYKVLPGETLRQLVERVGGVTPNAYLFAAELNRNSVREMQQQRLQTMADRMEADIKRNLAAKQQTALNTEETSRSILQAEAQTALLQRFRSAKASGRVVLEIPPQSATVKDIPDIALEDGDQFVVPSRPSTVSVMGMVYNENTFLYRPGKFVSDYLEQAGGPTRDADESHIYLVRADGSVFSTKKSNSILGRFSADYGSHYGEELMPGDTVVVPELLDKFSFTRELKDWTEIFYKFALGVAGIRVLRM